MEKVLRAVPYYRPTLIRAHAIRGLAHDVPQLAVVNVLATHAREADAHLLLVDADIRCYTPSNIGQFAGNDRLSRGGMVLPLWCRPPGQGNSTDFLACPLLYAVFGARIRQPLAGQMLLTTRMLDTIELDALPDRVGVHLAGARVAA